MKIGTQTFSGLAPVHSPRLLRADQAQAAVNARLISGDLETWRDTQHTQDLAKAHVGSIYLFENKYWFSWTGRVNAVRGPIPGDTDHRTYFTGTDQPRFTNNALAISGNKNAYPGNSYVLGIPAPRTAINAAVKGSVSDDNPALVESRAYTYTYVSKFGEEGPPAPVSNVVDVAPGQHVELSGFAPANGEFVLDSINVYRTASTGASTLYEKVDKVGIGRTHYTDDVAATALGDELPSRGWVGPPKDMHSLVALPNGVLAGASGLDICICAQYQPHAWPYDYRHTADDGVVGLGVDGNSLVVLTHREPYLITGASPASMTMTKVDAAGFACVSARGIATLDGVGVVYPTPDGLAAITARGATLLTANVLDRAHWQAYDPKKMLGVAYHGHYFGFHDNGCVVFAPPDRFYTLDLKAEAAYRDARTDTLYLAINNRIEAWDRGDHAYRPYQWRSKRFELPYPAVFSTARVRAASYRDLRLTVFADDKKVADLRPDDNRALRLPIGARAVNWSFELTGTDRVYDAVLAETVDEL